MIHNKRDFKDRVLERHPGARAESSSGRVVVVCRREGLPFPDRALGEAGTEKKAWEAAAKWLDARQEMFGA